MAGNYPEAKSLYSSNVALFVFLGFLIGAAVSIPQLIHFIVIIKCCLKKKEKNCLMKTISIFVVIVACIFYGIFAFSSIAVANGNASESKYIGPVVVMIISNVYLVSSTIVNCLQLYVKDNTYDKVKKGTIINLVFGIIFCIVLSSVVGTAFPYSMSELTTKYNYETLIFDYTNVLLRSCAFIFLYVFQSVSGVIYLKFTKRDGTQSSDKDSNSKCCDCSLPSCSCLMSLFCCDCCCGSIFSCIWTLLCCCCSIFTSCSCCSCCCSCSLPDCSCCKRCCQKKSKPKQKSKSKSKSTTSTSEREYQEMIEIVINDEDIPKEEFSYFRGDWITAQCEVDTCKIEAE